MKKIALLGSLLLLPFSSPLFGITLDGQLNDEEWAEATLYTDFVVISPFSLENPEYRTEARIYTNEDGIYVGITNFQPLSTQKAELSARDAGSESDTNIIIIDFDNTGIAGYHFEIANGGSIRDGIWRNETSLSTEWNGVWSAQTSSDEEHWYTEAFIPWDIAPMVSVDEGRRTVGLLFSRFVADVSKRYASSPIADSRQRFLSEFSTTTINDYASSSLQIFAYGTGRQDRVANEDTFDAGIDIFWKPSSSKQLSLSINPDFGQVESDNLVVNFSPNETFFNENRPFFTENQAIFDVSGPNNLRLIHTRRIGGKPDVGSEVGADIVAAVKFTSVGENLNYGFFSAVEDSDAVAEGRNYYAARAIRKTDDYSLGYVLTYTDRPDINRDAVVQAVDYTYDLNEEIQLQGQFVNSNIDSPLEDSSGSGGWMRVEQQISETWDHSLTVSSYDDSFEINDLGFLSRNNIRRLNYSTNKQNYDFAESSIVQDHNIGLTLFRIENAEGDHLNTGINLSDSWTFKNTSNGFANLSASSGGSDDLLTRGNGSLNTDSGYTLNMIYFTDRRNNFQWHLRGNFFDTTVGGNGYFAHFHPSYRFSDRFQVRAGVTYTDSDDWLLWQGGDQINSFAQERLLTEINFDATFSEKQEFSLKFEWVALNAVGQNSYSVTNAGDLANLNTAAESFTLSDVAIQLRYRYEIAPLSNIYVVYSRGGRATTSNEESSFSSLFSPGWEARDGDNFIVKVRYQF